MSRTLTLIAVVAYAVAVIVGAPTQSGATFVASSRNAASTVTAASDWTPPTVSLRDPGASVKDTVTITADATDAESGVASVAIQSLAPGASGWTTLCTATVAAYSCSWNTKSGPDGVFGLRAVATDRSGFATTSATVQTTVANNLLVVLASPGDVVRGNVPLTATLYNPGLAVYSVAIQYAPTGTTSWKTLCTSILAPYTCTWGTAGSAFTQGESYDLRAVATAGLTSTGSATVADIQVDNLAPTATMQDPGTPLRGTVTLAVTAADAESGVAQALIQHQRSGTSTWTTACTLTSEPYSCRYDTTQLTDGTYAFRSVVTDLAGNATTTSSVTGRVVDNTVSAVSMEDPGAYLSGTVSLMATASSTAGVASVRIDATVTGTTSWTPVCTDVTAPYTCAWNTSAVADGLYDVRAVMVDGRGATITSAPVTARRVDNNPLRAYDVQTVNGGAGAGRVDAGDVLRLTYTGQVNLASISSGWTGAPTPVSLRLRDGNLLGLGAKGDSVDILRGGSGVNLGSVNLRENHIKSNKTVQYNATMAASTTTVNGVTATVVTITVGTLASGSGQRTVSAASAMVWTPSAAALSATDGRAVSAAPTTELGASDRDF